MEDVDNDVAMEGDNQEAPTTYVFEDFGDPAAGFQDSTPSDELYGGAGTDTPMDSKDLELMGQERRQLPTGCCYDDRMKLHANADFGPKPHHPEDPGRIEAIMMKFKKAGLIFMGSDSEYVQVLRTNPTKYMWRIPAREAQESEICNVHLPQHYSWVRALSRKSTEELRQITKMMDLGRESIYVGSMTFEASLISAGGAIETCKSVVAGHVKNAFAIIRPPGHHAEYDMPMGFCMFNNVPIAARCCQIEYPETCRKILILDWDVHHGNGIQNIFYDNPNILYISLHVYQNGNFYPGHPENDNIADGGLDKCGADAGVGKNVNIGWHDQGMGDGEYLAAFQKIVMPIAQEFDPDLVIISAGFDAADGDELGGCFVTPQCYAHMTHMLMSLAGGKLAVCLEGGYNLRAISDSALAVARTLMGEPPPRINLPMISKEAAKVLSYVQAYQAPYWECMRRSIISVPDIVHNDGKRLNEVLRGYQRQNFSQKYGMCPLYIQRDALFRTYENQVLVTPDIDMARHILVIIHDPPEVLAQPDPLDKTLEPGNAWVVDGVTQYVDWAVSKKFGIMDINVPRNPAGNMPYTPDVEEKQLEAEIKELICYLWDNYIQLYENADEVFIMGVGYAYLGVKVLLLNRDCKMKLSGVVNFVTGSLRPIRSDTDERLSAWYKENSRVYVSTEHSCWTDPKLQGKVRKKRYGTVLHSPATSLNGMMKEHAKENAILDEKTSATEMASAESIRARMRIKSFLNPLSPSPSPPPPPPPPPVTPPLPPFTNGSMPMTLLVAPLDPPTANESADVEMIEWGQDEEDQEDQEEKFSPKYDPEKMAEGLRDAVLEVPIVTGDQTEVVTLSAVVRAGDDGTAAAAGPGVQLGALHHEGAPGGPHHAIRLHRDGRIDFQTEHGPHAVTLTTETLETYNGGLLTDEDHDRRLSATVVTALDLRFGALLQLDLAATDLTDLDRVLQIDQIVVMTDMAQAQATDSAHLPAAEPFQTPLKSPQRAKSPPRGPAALRAPPTGPSATRNFSTPHATPAALRSTPAPSYSSRADTPSPTVPPSGPRGYGPPRGNSFSSRGRGGWGTPASRPHFAPTTAASPATPPTGPSSVPTGPRASFSSRDTPAASPSIASKPFNPPTGPAAQGGQRQTLAQSLISSMPHIIPGGKLDPASTPLTTGVTKDLEAHHRRLKEEEERIREELKAKDEKLRKSLRMWEKLERESKSFELKSDMSESSLRTIAGEGVGGAAF
ncbi:hypothetical protein diail_3517 [Diaporthe ilicicola]|nr:hypothetical protein diail_3517 [Diaporthe ilicicola]